jgi:TatD DNase family protein
MLVDAHAHIDWYTDALNDALAQIEKHRILTMAVAMNVPSYLKSIEIARSSSLIIPTFGVILEAARYADKLHRLDSYRSRRRLSASGHGFPLCEGLTLSRTDKVFEYQCTWASVCRSP